MNRFRQIVILLFFACPLFSQGITDSVFSIRQVEIRSSRIFEKEFAGMSESRIDSMVLLQKNHHSLSELLSENTSVFIKNHGRGAMASASFRGTAASHTLVSWNGIQIASPMTGMVDFSLLPVFLVDDLKLRHGVASIADRSGGLGGSINLSNSAEWNKPLKLSYMQGAGSYGTFDEFIELGGGSERFHATSRIYHSASKNNYTFLNRGIGNLDPATGDLIHPIDTNLNADYSRYGLLQEIYFKPGSNDIISAKYWGQQANRALPRVTSYEGPENSNLNRQADLDHKLVIRWQHYSEISKWSLQSAYTSRQLDYSMKNLVPGLGLVPAVYSLSHQKSFLNKVAWSRDFSRTFSMEASLDVDLHQVVSQDTVIKSGYDARRSEKSAFFSLQKEFADLLNVKFMLRQDHVDSVFAPPLPYLGFDLRITKNKSMFLKGNVGGNYRQPTLNDLYWQPGGNPDLLAEKGFSGELGLEMIHAGEQGGVEGEITFFSSRISNWIIWIPSFKGYWEPRNITEVRSSGLESRLSIQGSMGNLAYRVHGTYAFTRSLNYGDPEIWGEESYGKQLVYVPLHSGNLMLRADWKGFFATYQHNSYSERFTTSSNDITRRDWLYPYFMNDFSLGKAFEINRMSMSAELKIFNLLNESYHSILYRPMPGRHFLLLLKIDIS